MPQIQPNSRQSEWGFECFCFGCLRAKDYDFVDINVGYQFVNILYRDSDGTLGVDVR